MRKVLLFANDLMPFGALPTSGGGLRCFQLTKGLEHHGFEVVVSMPGFTYLAERHFDQIPVQYQEFLWRYETQDEILRRVKPDAVIFASNWDHFNLSGKISIPLIVDLHGSRLIETSMWGQPASTERKIEVLSKADCLITAGKRQRMYFYGWLVQAGRVPKSEHFIRYIPISLSPDLPARNTQCDGTGHDPLFVSGGGWFPWQNQSQAIFTICEEITRRGTGRIQIYGTPHAERGASDQEQQIIDIFNRVKSLAKENDRIEVKGYIGRSELMQIYSHATVAVEAMEYNLERELAFTTRTIEYLWCGLPVIYNNFSEIAEHIQHFDAGWTVDPLDAQAIAATVDEIFDNPALVRQKSINASNLIRERFTWDKTIVELVDFLRSPQKAELSDPVRGLVYTRPQFMRPKGDSVEISLGGLIEEVTQTFVIPAETIAAVEVPLRLASADSVNAVFQLDLRLRTASGRVIQRRKIHGSKLILPQGITLALPTLFPPRGGEVVTLEIRVKSSQPDVAPIRLRCLTSKSFPLGELHVKTCSGNAQEGNLNGAQAVALCYVPAEYSWYYIAKIRISRAAAMIRQGEWTRLIRAVRRRLNISAAVAKLCRSST